MSVVTVGRAPAIAYNKAWGPGCIANIDEINPVYVGTDPGLTDR